MSSPIINTISGSFPIKQSADEVIAVILVPENYNKVNCSNQNMMIFDHNNLNGAYVKVSNIKYPDNDYNVSFENPKNYISFYTEFLRLGNKISLSDASSIVDYKKFGDIYRILCFDVSTHKDYLNVNTLDILFYYKFSQNPANQVHFYCVLFKKRKGILEMGNKTFRSLNSIASN